MGILDGVAEAIPYDELARNQPFYMRLAVQQFLSTLSKNQSINNQFQPATKAPRWGWEIEGHCLTPDQTGRLSLFMNYPRQEMLKETTMQMMVEFSSWMFEAVPKKPYTGENKLLDLVSEMRALYSALNASRYTCLTIPHIPFLGTRKTQNQPNRITQSEYVTDDQITPHPRYIAMLANMIKRRKGLPHAFLPVFRDINTHCAHQEEPKPEYVHIDSLLFGFSSACLQTTFEAHSFCQARHLHDQLNVISPILLALTAGTPFVKGKIVDIDARYHIITDTVDDRTVEEKDPNHPSHVPCSRHGYCNFFIGNSHANLPEYSNFDSRIRKEAENCIRQEISLRNIQLDQMMVRYLGILVSRDLTYAFKSTPLHERDTEIYDLLLGTHWGSVKMKLPTGNINWRVELRTMEIQLLPDQNAAFCFLSYLLTCLITEREDINFYMPITSYRQNMRRAHLRDAVRNQKFLWRTNVHSNGPARVEQMSCYEIFFGKGEYEGLFGLIERQLKRKEDAEFNNSMEMLKDFLLRLLTGKKLTLAQWMRGYVDQHPLYKHDSVLPAAVMDELLRTLEGIQKGSIKDPNFSSVFSEHSSQSKEMVSGVVSTIETDSEGRESDISDHD